MAKSFEVNPGDVYDLEVFAKYEDTESSSPADPAGILTSLISVFNLPVSGGVGLESQQARTAFTTNAGTFIGSGKQIDANVPNAYLNYVLFNEQFVLIDFGYDKIEEGADQNGVHDLLSLHVNVKQKGYLYVFLSNENGKLQNVYFDDFKIVRYTDIQQVQDYYPFGLQFNSYRRENSVQNKYLFNGGAELQNELDLGLYSTLFRLYDPAIGRFTQIDPLADVFFRHGWCSRKRTYPPLLVLCVS